MAGFLERAPFRIDFVCIVRRSLEWVTSCGARCGQTPGGLMIGVKVPLRCQLLGLMAILGGSCLGRPVR